MSKENVVAESWEDADADPVKELMEKVEKVKLLQRKEEKKEAFFEKVKAEENNITVPKLQADDGLGPVCDEPKRVFLRRPKDGFTAESVVESTPSVETSPENPPVSRSRPHHKSNQKEQKQPAPTYEERQAAYQAARNRIMGTEYKPDNQEIKEIKFIDRSKSPETLKMTPKNMAEHYGEELSRELMQQPLEPVNPPNEHYVPDFSQPPPCMTQQDGCGVFTGPRGFHPMPPNYPQMHHQQQFVENHYYMQMNGQAPVQYANQGQMQHYLPQEPAAVSSTSQGFVEDHAYYYPTPGQQQMNYVQNNLPNMSYPPPAFPVQTQQNQQIVNQMNAPQMFQMQHQNGQMMNQYQMQNGMGRGNNHSRGNAQSGGAGRGQNRQQGMYQNNGGPQVKPPPLMSQTQDRIPNRNGGNGQRQFQQGMHQNGMFIQNQNFHQNNMNNGRKQSNKNGRNGQQRGNDNSAQKNNFIPSQSHNSFGQNPIPFGCPPRHATAIREQNACMPPNTGDGLLGAHPMAATQWPSLTQNRHQ